MTGGEGVDTIQLSKRCANNETTIAAHEEKLITLFANTKKLEQKIEGALTRIDEQRKIELTISDLNTTIERLNGAIDKQALAFDYMRDDLGKLNNRIEKIESKPSRRLDTIVQSAITAVVGGIIGFFIANVLGG